eukprot:GHVO01022978.1.p1 GENE.GHVO01022978.1~~GHVO01022978.1.p1  ORF type:complete len:752 (-),score=179.63 GHVO01022978.1:43-2298(-)
MSGILSDAQIVLGEGADCIDEIAPPIATSDRHEDWNMSDFKRRLPIFKHKTDILYAIETHRVVLLAGHTGSGKSTQLPQYLYESGWTGDGMNVIVILPHRIAVVNLAQRVADETGTKLGQLVGYRMRFEGHYSSDTSRIIFMTDGVFLKLLHVDPSLSRTAVVVLDDAHIRSARGDLICGLLKKIMRKRKYLRFIISSASMDMEMYSNYFRKKTMSDDLEDRPSRFDVQPSDRHRKRSRPPNDSTGLRDMACICMGGSKMYDVEIQYMKHPTADYVQAAVQTVRDIHIKEGAGDVLVFLTSPHEVDVAAELIREILPEPPEKIRGHQTSDARPKWALVMPLYGGLSFERQLRCFKPLRPGIRKIVVSTDVAEASVTLENIGFVVDCGLTKVRAAHEHCDIDTMFIVPVSKSSANQRAGRAGRQRVGKCMRLYTAPTMAALTQHSVPEIVRSNIADLLLLIKSFGIEDVINFDFLTPPQLSSFSRGLERLHALAAIDDDARLTRPFGFHLAEMPVPSHIGALLLMAARPRVGGMYECLSECLTIAAMLSVSDPWVKTSKHLKLDAARKGLGAAEGDMLTLNNVYRSWDLYRLEDDEWSHRHFLNTRIMTRAASVRATLQSKMTALGYDTTLSCGEDAEALSMTICAALFINAAQRQTDGTYKLCRWARHDDSCLSPAMMIDPSSICFASQPEWLVYDSALGGAGEEIVPLEMRSSFPLEKPPKVVAMMKHVSVIDPQWLGKVAPHFYVSQIV